MMLKDFNYFLPETIEDAQELLKSLDEAVFLAGGTFSLPLFKKSGKIAKNIIGLKKVRGLDSMRMDKDILWIGSMMTLDGIARDPAVREYFPAFCESIMQIAAVQIRNMATLGGNICSCLPWVDLPAILLAMGAILDFGDKKVTIGEFLKSPKACLKKNLLRGIMIPVQKVKKFIFIRLPRTNATDIPLCAVCFVETDKDVVLTANIGNSYPFRFKVTESFLQKSNGCKLEDALETFSDELSFQKDAYRKEMLRVCFKKVLEHYERA
ncbi:MAG: FAD binding domain-containing protein [Candidatus Omnitrophota bacterium]